MLIISFATPNYEEEVYILLRDLRKFEINHEVHLIPDFKSWEMACNYKSKFIKEMLLKHKCPVVWLDADTEIRQYPNLFSQLDQEPRTSDIAVNFFKDVQLCGGVMYFNYNPAILTVIDAWIKECENNPKIWESENLVSVLSRFPRINLFRLPREYCTFDLCEDQSNPVFWSRQASRKWKAIQNAEISNR